MNKSFKIMYLIQEGTNDFYQEQRKKYDIDAEWLYKRNSFLNRVLRKLFREFSPRLLKFLYGDWKYKLDRYDLIIVHESLYSSYSIDFIRKRTNKRIILWYWNSIGNGTYYHDNLSPVCECWSYDKRDCKSYNMKFNTTYYFSTITLPKQKILNDIMFVGMDKGRVDKLLELEGIFKSQGIKSHFHITNPTSTNIKKYDYKNSISYSEVLHLIAESRCILDLVQENQNGLTQRPMESIFLRKKLITNDITVKDYDFYNFNNIFIIGQDDIATLSEFVNSEYINIDNEILKNYDFDKWLERFIGEKL